MRNDQENIKIKLCEFTYLESILAWLLVQMAEETGTTDMVTIGRRAGESNL